MIEFDKNGSKLCSYQADVFSASLKFQDCSSMIFLRRFFNSRFARDLDSHDQNIFPYSIEESFYALDTEYGKIKYGSKKINENILHWLGYITRYICYTREITSKYLYKNISLKLFIDNYYVYHTQSEEWVITRILEDSKLPENFFDKEIQTKSILRKLWIL